MGWGSADTILTRVFSSDFTATQFPVTSIKNTTEFVLYGNHEVKFHERWGLNYGLRLTTWSNQGEAFEFVFDANRIPVDTLFFNQGESYNEYNNLEPRITLSHFFKKHASLKASYSRNVQNVHLISNSISPFTSLEVWLPSSINIQPQIADQVALGYFQFLPNTGLSFETEVFYKHLGNQIDYEAHAETLLNPLLERELRFGIGRAYGIELQLKKEKGRLRGWLGYSYSRAKSQFDEINEGREFNAFFDRPQEVNIVLGYDINLRWTLGLNWNYYTGAPFSSPISFFNINQLEVPIYG